MKIEHITLYVNRYRQIVNLFDLLFNELLCCDILFNCLS